MTDLLATGAAEASAAAALSYTYATERDLVDRFGRAEIVALTDHDHLGAIDPETLLRALRGAEAEIDGYLGARYAVPVPEPVPPRIVDLAADLARCRLYVHDTPEDVTRRCTDARAFLRGVALGQYDIAGLGERGDATTAGLPQVDAPERLFTRDTLKDF